MIDRQKIEDIAFLLPWVGFFLFLPPILAIFDRDIFVYDIPLLPLYLFSIWAFLIGLGYILSRKLGETEEPQNGNTTKLRGGNGDTTTLE